MRHAHGKAGECYTIARTTKQEKVRELQRTLYRAAKADTERRFHALCDKVYRRDFLERAWGLVRANRGAAGIDRATIADIEQHGVSRLLDGLTADLKNGRRRADADDPRDQRRRHTTRFVYATSVRLTALTPTTQ